jgi:alpha-tubulin suppressor-like RCC1 family protein
VTADRFEATVISKRTKRPVRPVILAATAGILVGLSALQVAAGNAQTCARLDDGSVKCWGSNVAGELGLGDTQTRGDGPGQMGAALPVVQLK